MKNIHQPVRKTDADALLTGKPVYTEDMTPSNALKVKLIHSPYAFARIKNIDTSKALLVPGVECVLTYKDFSGPRFTSAGQTHPEPSPLDRHLLDEYVRYVGDAAAVVAADTEQAAEKAAKLVKIEYEVLEPVLDFEKAIDNTSVVHPEEDYLLNFDVGNEKKRNIISGGNWGYGDMKKTLAECDKIVTETFYTKANQQTMMETYRACTYYDEHGKLTVISSTQVPFHVRRHLARAFGLKQSQVRVRKPRIGGGFGAKQTMVGDWYPAMVTVKTGKPAVLVYSRKEAFTCGNSRHAMKIKVTAGADHEGIIKAISIDALSDGGAYGEHSTTTIGLVSAKTQSLYSSCLAQSFDYRVVYTNTMPAAAFRGYGATQGCFAVESVINKLAAELNIDPTELRKKNLTKVGDRLKAQGSEPLRSSTLAQCIEKGKKLIDWDNKYPCKKISENIYRSVGMAITMQGSGISNIDTANAEIRLADGNFYNLMVGAGDMGTGCDTIFAQMAAEILSCEMSEISVSTVDTDFSPFDPGTYASSGTYVTGMAVVKAAEDLKEKILSAGAELLQIPENQADFDGVYVHNINKETEKISRKDIALNSMVGSGRLISGFGTYGSPVSPPPFVAGFAETEINTATGKVTPLQFIGVVDCGTVINTNLAKIQAEGGFAQGIGMALYEDVHYRRDGKMMTDSFLQYKIPTRLDTGKITADFVESHEPTGPFGAKSIGEVVINTPGPAINHTILNATGKLMHSLPMTGENVLRELGKIK
ncbi:MAG: xanthine dehydrogenase family protein molybdopterin-binding subunit [Bacillota bacterium]|jgi:CO/xanthine dehydrogenase Mo-binding subunit